MQALLKKVQEDGDVDNEEVLELAKKGWEIESGKQLDEKQKEIEEKQYELDKMQQELEAGK